MFERVAKYRTSMRQRDLAESKLLLWELVTHEPTVLQCFSVIEATCMAQGLFCRIDGEQCGDKFKKFLDRHWTLFCKQCLRAFFTYGFVPWVVRKLDDGEEVPEVLPNGTFHWYTEVPSKTAQAVVQQDNPGLVTYRVKITAPLDIKDEDVHVFVFVPPALDVSVYSMLYATVPSPLSHILIDYKHLRQAQIRRSHADAWNTTAKLICKFKPTVRVQEDPTSSLMDFADDSYLTSGMYGGMPLFAQLAATNLWSRDAQVFLIFFTCFLAFCCVYLCDANGSYQRMPLFLGKATEISVNTVKFYREKIADAREQYGKLIEDLRVLKRRLECQKRALLWIDTKPHIIRHVQRHGDDTFSELVVSNILHDSAYNRLNEKYASEEGLDHGEFIHLKALDFLLEICRKVPTLTLRQLRDRVSEYEHKIQRILCIQDDILLMIGFWEQMIKDIRERQARANLGGRMRLT